jgi:hypothetical protein
MGVGGQCHALATLPPKRPSTHCTGGWMGKENPPLEFDPHTVQPVESHYTDYVIMVHRSIQNWVKMP